MTHTDALILVFLLAFDAGLLLCYFWSEYDITGSVARLFCMRCFNSSHCASHFGPLCNGKGEMHGFVPYKAEYAIAAWSREERGTLSRTVRGKKDNNPKTKTT